jgi:heat-inducible transcriptional repressor
LWNRLRNELFAVARTSPDDVPVFVEGAHAVLQHPEFRDVERLGHFLSTLQERAALVEMLGQALDERASPSPPPTGVHVVIGEEHQRPALSDFSFVSSTYFVGPRERGAIGVLGPTRMDYGRTAAAVRFMARTVGDLLTRLSVV